MRKPDRPKPGQIFRCAIYTRKSSDDGRECPHGENLWAGRGTLRFFPSEIEEHLPLAPLEILGAYHFSSGYSFPGGEVLHRSV